MNSVPHWVSTKLNPDKQIFAKQVFVKDRTGRKMKGHLEVETANGKGQIVVSAIYNSSALPSSVALAKFYLNQEQMDEFERAPEHCILETNNPLAGLEGF